ncbi:hypothetical protein [Enterobacter sp. R1(2018)]|uniref:hypothetical protein n=1 Tax=Enterobacter sp. R1(2018) TaxID=2447891 RepID=UPI000EB15826|nr:hypothetical protein [Enterobacter sp. R1(2018)]RKQ38549.1 hypothetical protein D8M09_17290 [Enterobacter sp. R1(2018)]
MSEFKGTPGPWSAGEDEESMATSIITAGSGDILCVVGTFMTSIEEDLANAALIAAAPDLLEALQRLKTEITLSDVDMDYIESHFRPWLDKAQAAISKATGE